MPGMASAPDEPLWRWSATEVVRATTAGEVSCREVTESVLARVHEVNPHLNAITLVLHDEARRQADALDETLAHGDAVGPLHGVPVTIKDNIDVRGQRTPNGLPGLAGLIAPDDSPVTRNFGGAGAVTIGRTNTPEFSMRITTNNPLYGLTRNPWGDAVSCGGSSGGAGAAVAAGLGAIGHGNDIAGSVRVPALHCGVVGLKPSQGRVPAFVPSATSERLTVSQLMSGQGPLARSVADVRLGLAVMSGRDHRDPFWVPAPLDGPRAAHEARVGLVDSVPGLPLDPSVAAALATAAEALTAAGCTVERVQVPDLVESGLLASRLLFTDMARGMIPMSEQYGSDEIRWYFRTLFELAPPITDVGEYLDALAARSALARRWLTLLEDFPTIVCPLLTRGLLAVDEDFRDAPTLHAIWQSLYPSITVNLMGLPAAMVPTGLHAGLPTGVQVIGGRFREDRCLATAELIEAATPVPTPPG